MGELLETRTWCRQRWCRAATAKTAEHFDGDGCSCHGTIETSEEAPSERPEPEQTEPTLPLFPSGPPPAGACEPRLTVLTAKASRLRAFACRACGAQSRRMIEAPAMFFRCEKCASANRWPPSRRMA